MTRLSAGSRLASIAIAAALLTGCAGPGSGAGAPHASPSVAASATPAATSAPSASPTATPTATPTAAPSGSPSSTASCSGPIPAAHNLVLATLAGSTAVVLRDVTNLGLAVTLCTFSAPVGPRFASQSVVGYTVQSGSDLGAAGHIQRLDLAAGRETTVASWATGVFGSGLFDWSPDGASLTYIGGGTAGPTWHLLAGGSDRVLSTLPAVPGRGVSRENDDFMVGFSPDGLYLALVQTFATGGSGETAPLQVRRVSDGSLVYSATSGTMGVWASVPSRLFFRDTSGNVSRWDPSSGVAAMISGLKWSRPHASPDGRWITYTSFDSGGLPHVGLYSVQGNSLGPQLDGLRSGSLFVDNNLLWYQEEAATPGCGPGGCSQTTGRTFLYDIGGAAESASRITGLFDAWPRVTAAAGL